jgi:hypothetical protein
MSMPTLTAGDFDDFEFEALVADFHDSPAEPSPALLAFKRPSRTVADREAIDQSMGIYRRRTHERRN